MYSQSVDIFNAIQKLQHQIDVQRIKYVNSIKNQRPFNESREIFLQIKSLEKSRIEYSIITLTDL